MSSAVCRVNRLYHDWNNGLVCRWCQATRTPAEAIVSGLASRRGGDEESARALLDAHADQVLREDGQAYPGELAMLRSLVRTLRVVARPDDADMGEVRRLLQQHAGDDAAARAAAGEGAVAPDFFQPGHVYAREHHGCYVEFRVTAIDTSPDGQQRLARGWRTDWRSGWEATDSDDLTGWTDVTEWGEPA